MASSNAFQGQLYCEKHSLLTCVVCLHSINSVKDGFIPLPEPGSRIPCSEQAHSVEPVFGSFKATAEIRGFHDGLSPEDRKKYMTDLSEPQDGSDFGSHFHRCHRCGLDYLLMGGKKSHPSHVTPNGDRYILVAVEPFEFSRSLNRISCSANFLFSDSHARSNINAAFKCSPKVDSGSVQWNLDNAELEALVQLLHYVEDDLIPYRKRIVEKYVYTNSEYFAGQAWRFQLLVYTPLNRELLEFLSQAHRLKYNVKRKAFVERNSLGLVTKQYPATEERRHQTVCFLSMIRRLASLGIRVYWQHTPPKPRYIAAKERFMHDPHNISDFREIAGVLVPNHDQGILEEEDLQDLYNYNSPDNPLDHEDYDLVRRESPALRGANSFEELYQED
ncbi:uncharacterized protein F4807DRAFT_421185 [Annulohypoxylon truncatum]|uniref:uncharacterized protein n=1 Tax=Annulohypoxylon truncatum TaxID=327061 RepID=UPI002007822D|nr:uncharacterized protein F4807DRAFT_421185 [Annulohypoxylon truncatum]KAI1211000.1 hypothetical protein F4807DRAFT_421185 [Annulohypoxylon truncatum]